MNAFYEHHKDSIRFGYRCFDRILLNGLIQPFQQPERVVGFFDTYRHLYPVSRDVLRGTADQFQLWVKEQAGRWGAPIIEAPKGRRDEFVEPYFSGAKPDQVVVILKAREPARIMTAIGDKKVNRWHLQIADRWVVQYNFYVNDQRWGRMFVRLCPYLPFSARVYLNQHHWLANRMREEGIDFQQCSNAFLRCGTPERLQELADTLTAEDLSSCGQKWLTRFTPFFSERERRQAGCQHRLFFSQIEFCDNLIFDRRAALDKLGERLLDANRTIGQPKFVPEIPRGLFLAGSRRTRDLCRPALRDEISARVRTPKRIEDGTMQKFENWTTHPDAYKVDSARVEQFLTKIESAPERGRQRVNLAEDSPG